MREPVAELKDRLKQALALRNKKAADLSNDLEIPKSAVSQYLSGKSKNMDSKRMYSICVYLDVSEAWLMGFDVPIERTQAQKKNDALADIVVKLRFDNELLSVVDTLSKLDAAQLASVKQMLNAFVK